MFKENPVLKNFFRAKVDAPLSSTDVKCLLNQRREAKFVIASFYEPQSQYIANQSGSVKETVSWKIGKNIEMLVCFICLGTLRKDFDVNHHYQITMNQRNN